MQAAGRAAVRVRYAPSPTGYLHLGGLRTALFNYLFARKQGGTFIVRIEDTDRKRLTEGATAGLLRALEACHVNYDEGPRIRATPAGTAVDAPAAVPDELTHDGAYGPYIQSERHPIYQSAAKRLLDCGHAYRCFCGAERLTALRESQSKRGAPSMYDRACLRLDKAESDRRAAAGESHTIRMLVPEGSTQISDLVVGEVKFGHAVIDDQVLMKSDGFPTYHLAAVVDDHEMAISHVIRGQEWLSSTPKHVLLYASLGWQPPAFAHLPLLLNTDRSKLSKRNGDAAVEDFLSAGYLPAALVNFVALLGWTPGDGKEVLSINEMVERFELKDVNKANAIVDRSRLDYFNAQHIRRCIQGVSGSANFIPKTDGAIPLAIADTPSLADLRRRVEPLLRAAALPFCTGAELGLEVDTSSGMEGIESPERVNALLLAQSERVHHVKDFVPLILPFLVSERVFASYWKGQLASPAAAHVLGKPASGSATGAATSTTSTAASASSATSANGGVSLPSPAPTDSLANASMPSESTVRADVTAHLLTLGPGLEELAARWSVVSHDDFCRVGSSTAADCIKAVAKQHKLPVGKFMLSTRFCLTAMDVGATMSDTLRLLGRDVCVARLRGCQNALALGR